MRRDSLAGRGALNNTFPHENLDVYGSRNNSSRSIARGNKAQRDTHPATLDIESLMARQRYALLTYAGNTGGGGRGVRDVAGRVE